MKVQLVTPATFEPVSLADIKIHSRIDSGSLSGNIDETQLIPPALHAVNTGYTLFYELLTLDVAPGGAGWAAGDTLTGATSTKSCIIVEKLTALTYTVKERTGAFTLGEIISNGTATADQGAAYPTFSPSKVEVLGYQAVVILTAGIFTTGTADVKIQDSDDGITWANWTGGAFVQVTSVTANRTQEIQYTGTKRYIRTVANVLIAACPFSTSVTRMVATSIEDDWLTDAIAAARMRIEGITRRQIITATWDYFLDDWPGRRAAIYRGGSYNGCDYLHGHNFIRIPFGNLQTVVSLTYTDSAGTVTTMVENTDYIVETNGDQCGRIVLPFAHVWPTVVLNPSHPIKIRFVCGWTTAALVPAGLKKAILMMADGLYNNRADMLLSPGRASDIENIAVPALISDWRLYEEF